MGARRLERDGRIMATLPGPGIDFAAMRAIKDELLALVRQRPVAEILVDFRQLRNLDADALGPLLTLHRELSQEGGRLVLCGLDDAVFGVFEAIGLDRVFRFEAAPPAENIQ